MSWIFGFRRHPRSVAGFAFVLTCYLGGFLYFLSIVPRAEIPIQNLAPSDGIVVLTGGVDRLPQAMTLLAAGKGQRLLISGVNPDTSRSALRTLIGGSPERSIKFDCCVDLDRAATNTVENALETVAWAQAKGYGSLIVVTSAYHVPRTGAELRRVDPNLRLTMSYVVSPTVPVDGWWQAPRALRLLLAEYTKYLVMTVRHSLG